jgi:hypothetical protein
MRRHQNDVNVAQINVFAGQVALKALINKLLVRDPLQSEGSRCTKDCMLLHRQILCVLSEHPSHIVFCVLSGSLRKLC